MTAFDGKVPRYRIGAVAKLTGVSTHQIRVWERRYGTVLPTRSEGGDRLYTDDDVEHLRLLHQLNEAGHAIGSIANLTEDQLRNLLKKHNRVDPSAVSSGDATATVADRFLDAIRRMDLTGAERTLSRGSVAFEPRDFTLSVLLPMLRRIGDLWETGEFNVAHEHAASAALRTQLGMLVRLYSSNQTAKVALCATPAGELHEFGALAAALFCAASGYRVLYLGPNLPASHIAQAAITSGASFVLLSVVSRTDTTELEVENLMHLLPPDVEVFVGGDGALGLDRVSTRVHFVPSLERLHEYW